MCELRIVFGLAMARLAGVLRTFCCELVRVRGETRRPPVVQLYTSLRLTGVMLRNGGK
jgi:cation transport regulator ChaC